MKILIYLVITFFTVQATSVEITGGRRNHFNNGEKCGNLSIVHDEHSEKFKALNIASIPVFTFFPAELSTVAGVVTLVKQPRISHIAIKAKDWNIPNADISGASCLEGADLENNPNGAFLECFPGISDGDHVYMKAQRDGRVLNLEKVEKGDPRCPELVTSIAKVEVTANLDFNTIVDHSEIGWKDFDKVGSKAANYAELVKAMNDEGREVVRPGFAIPFYYYNQFIEENPIVKGAIARILADERVNDPLESVYRGEQLSILKLLIMSDHAKVNGELVDKLLEKAETFKDAEGLSRRLKFRSSTNAEDLPNFSGAGLYTSKSYKPTKGGEERSDKKKKERIVKALKTVWASIWNKRAFDERALYGIDHSEVYMGVQVNLAFPDELASGVIVTKNIVEQDGAEGIYIEAQRGDEYSVENPEPGVIPERNLVETQADSSLIVIKRLGNSTVDIDGKTILEKESPIMVLSEDDIADLTDLSIKAESYFENLLGEEGKEFALDIEFKVDRDLEGNRTIYFKQARPYIIQEQ